MTVEINKRKVETGEGVETLSRLLEQENLSGPGKAVAIDSRLAPRAEWDNIRLTEGMQITVIRAVCGG